MAEVVCELKNITGDAYAAATEEVAGLLQQVKLIEERLPAPWLAMAAVRSALGRAYSQLDDFAKAISHYRTALSLAPADFPVKSIEQLANLQVRWGVKLLQAQAKVDSGETQPIDLIHEGRRQLERLLQFGVTVERLSLMGSACKRLAMVTEGEARNEALSGMIDYYRQAHELAREQTASVNPYPLLNWLVGLQLTDLRNKTRKAKSAMGAWLAEVEKVADDRDLREPNFWNGILHTEGLLVRCLAAGDLPDHQQEIVDGYLRVFRRGATPKELRSVVEHLDFLVALLDGEAQKPLHQALTAMRDQLTAPLKG